MANREDRADAVTRALAKYGSRQSKFVGARVPNADARELERIAKQRGKSVADVVRGAVEGQVGLTFASTAALNVEAGQLPTEFRIFKRGMNDSLKGPTLFDAQAAADVIAAYRQHGVDLMIDLEHHSLSADDVSRADAPDARGWFKLEVRNGELWATGVKWTADGAARLRSKSQRYTSPAFHRDPKTKRVTLLRNVAICAMPATYGAQALVAASAALTPDEKFLVKLFEELRKAFHLPASATPEEISAKFAEVVANLPDAAPVDAPPTGETADAPPPTALSAHEIDACRKAGVSREDYASRKAAITAAMRREPSAPARKPAERVERVELTDRERAEIKKRGWTEAEFRQRKARAVRT